MSDDERPMRTPEAAAYVGLSPGTLSNMRSLGGGPRYYKPSKIVIYRKRDLDEWLDGRYCASTADYNVSVG